MGGVARIPMIRPLLFFVGTFFLRQKTDGSLPTVDGQGFPRTVEFDEVGLVAAVQGASGPREGDPYWNIPLGVRING